MAARVRRAPALAGRRELGRGRVAPSSEDTQGNGGERGLRLPGVVLPRRSPSLSVPGQGTRDHPPAHTALRDRLLAAVVTCFKRHGAAAIDTPVLELRVRRRREPPLLLGNWAVGSPPVALGSAPLPRG